MSNGSRKGNTAQGEKGHYYQQAVQTLLFIGSYLTVNKDAFCQERLSIDTQLNKGARNSNGRANVERVAGLSVAKAGRYTGVLQRYAAPSLYKMIVERASVLV